jgi:hypothetical protein
MLIPALLALQATAPHLGAALTTDAPVIDGRLDEPAWVGAPKSDAFIQKSPDEGRPPVERTTVRILYDHAAIYVAVACEQKKTPVVGRLTRRDREVEADSVTVVLDSRHDGKTAFQFMVNAAGVLSDGTYSNDTAFSSDWDENWEAKTTVTPDGWSAELKIPLRILRFAAVPEQTWGLQVRRYVSMRQETDEWAFIPKTVAGQVSQFGHLDGLVGLHDAGGIELRPFVVASVVGNDPEIDSIARGIDLTGSLGLDFKWHITQNLTLDAAINPDFGQIEADQVTLNLSSYETFFPEKRPFFLEGADTFTTPLQLVYTRRIGRGVGTPAIREDDPYGERLIRAPGPAAIYGAVKLVGELGGGFSIGELLAVTSRNSVDVLGAGSTPAERVADPLTAFKALRLTRDFGKRAQVGAMVTAVSRIEPGGDYPVITDDVGRPTGQLCPGGEEQPIGARCFHDAYVGGVDARLRSPSGDYVATAQGLASVIEGGPPRTMDDGTVIQSGDVAPSLKVQVKKEGGNLVAGTYYVFAGRNVDYNDLGFMPRQNMHELEAYVAYRKVDGHGPFRESETGFAFFDRESLDFLNQQRAYFLFTDVKFKNFWSVFAEIAYRHPHFDDREVGDGAALERDQSFTPSIGVASDKRERVSFSAFAQTQILADGLTFFGEGDVTFRILPELDVQLLPQGTYTSGEPRYFDDAAGRYLFGRQEAQSLALTLRATYTFTPRITLQAYGQAFLASEDYTDFTSYPAGAAGSRPVIHLADLEAAPAPAPDDNPNYEQGTFNANVLLRWEYLLGSTVAVVYTHAQEGFIPGVTQDLAPRPARLNFRLIRPRAASDVLLLKLSYWWAS